ncbi:hypothetical protein BDF20DRAFT_811046, partial [Mycotypha africana]|uniref:uncharacterized protein n=1 Tax=Mycotypha africana TaxID=64632 RepID=UPI002301B529
NVYKKERERTFNPMEEILTGIKKLKVVLVAITSQKSYPSHKSEEKETTAKYIVGRPADKY